MTASIFSIATEVPKTFLHQKDFAEVAAKHLNLSKVEAQLLERIATSTQIHKRHSVIEDFATHGLKGPFFEDNASHDDYPLTAARNHIYKKHAPLLAQSVCEKALNDWGGERRSITHVISVSCTGMIAPGIEFLLIDRLGLSREVERLGINFMGCFGAFKGLAIAKALALEDPKHRVLLVCTELCSLHFQADAQKDTLVANSLFADGAAAVVVGCQPRGHESPLYAIQRQASQALEETGSMMTWDAGNYGYKMRLSTLVPSQIEKHISPFVSRLTGKNNSFESYRWAIHPGGKSILEAIGRACRLKESDLDASWKVLEEYGNMSSPTFLFVLHEVLKAPSEDKEVIGLGFGPGLSVEGIVLKQTGSYVAR